MFQRAKEFRFLLEELTKRDFTIKYKRSILGVFWSVLSPLLTLLVMRVVFTRFFGTNIEHYTTYLFAGNLVFSYFSEATNQGMMALTSNTGIFSKVNVPKYMFVLSSNASSFINFTVSFVVFLIFAAIDGITFQWKMLALVYPILCLAVFNIGVSMILSALYLFFADMRYLYSVFTLLLMYVSAIFYSVDDFPLNVQRAFLANPVYAYIKFIRLIVIDGTRPSGIFIVVMALYALIALGLGSRVYKKYNQRFMYYV